MSSMIQDSDVVLFQGDSITDGDRNRDSEVDLGHGYAMMAASWFSALHPDKSVRFINRGLGGDDISGLLNRWQTDFVEIQPTWVSILIGINNAIRIATGGMDIECFEADYRQLLEKIRGEMNARIILLEPFLLEGRDDYAERRMGVDKEIEVVRRLAREFAAVLLPIEGILAQACVYREPSHWSLDGVHPTLPGHALIAQAWLRAVKAL